MVDLLSVLPAIGHWVPGLFRTCSSETPTKSKRVYGQVWDDPIPTNFRVIAADGHFMVSKTLCYSYHKSWVTGSKGHR